MLLHTSYNILKVEMLQRVKKESKDQVEQVLKVRLVQQVLKELKDKKAK